MRLLLLFLRYPCIARVFAVIVDVVVVAVINYKFCSVVDDVVVTVIVFVNVVLFVK